MLTPMSDREKREFSPYNINTISSIEVMSKVKYQIGDY